MIKILSIDPGETTGVCAAVVLPSDEDIRIVKSCTLGWAQRFDVRGLLQSTFSDENGWVSLTPDVIVVEGFRLYANRAKQQIGNDFPSVQLIGMIEFVSYELGVLDRVVYQPASCMKMVTIEPKYRSQLMNSEHARDAFKHLRYYAVTKLFAHD